MPKVKMNFKKSLQNNIYILKIAYKASPKRVILNFILNILQYLVRYFFTIVATKVVFTALEDHTPIVNLVPFFVLIGIIILVAGILDSWYNNKFRKLTDIEFAGKINMMLFKKASEIDLACYENTDFYKTYTRASNEANDRVIKVLDNFSNFAGVILSAILITATVMVMDPFAAFILIVPIISQFIVAPRYNKARYDFEMANTKANRMKSYTSRTIYLASHAKEIRLTGISNVLFKNYDNAIEEIISNTDKFCKKIAFYRVLNEVFLRIFQYPIVFMYVAAKAMVFKTIDIAEMMVLLNAIMNFSWTMINFTNIFNTINEQSLYIENLKIFINYDSKITNNAEGKTPGVSPSLSMVNMTFSYEGSDTPVLKGININIKPGQKIALVGHNGAGKTTLIKLLLRLYDVTDGKIMLDGIDIKDYDLDEYRDLFGTVFQDYKVLSMSVAENIMMRELLPEDDAIVEDALKHSGAYNKIMESPNKIAATLTREFDDEGLVLSGGEIQKIAIARGYAGDNPIMILDEPSSALDPIAEYEMFENLIEICRDKTVIFISHRLSSAVFADCIYLMENGEIIESGTHAELMQLGGSYADMYQKQAERYVEEDTYEKDIEEQSLSYEICL